jgi:hypothetical protein
LTARQDDAKASSQRRRLRRSDLPGLGGEPDRGTGGAEALIVASFDELEEEAVLEHMRVDLEEFAFDFSRSVRDRNIWLGSCRDEMVMFPRQGRLIV